MNLIPWRNKRESENVTTADPFPLARFRNSLDEAFERMWRDPWGAGLTDLFPLRAGFGLKTDLAESVSEVTVTAELPGVDPEDVDISVSGNTLTIRGEKKQEKKDKKQDYHYVERHYGSFHRSIQLPNTVDPDKIEANYKNGVLTVTIPKHAEAKPRRITVKHE